ncbi:MAG: thioredoxin family protein [Synergistaceae bacterium]|jgi:glutaredoxin|nr:thioredoxin family protein [Synergistaceae bacterium]
MKEIKMFMMETCPHCKKALSMIEELLAAHPEYKEIPFKKIDERKEPEFTAKFKYYYVPTFFVGDKKIHEGVPTKAAVMKVFMEAFD